MSTSSSSRMRILIVALVLFIGFLLLVLQLVRWQVVEREEISPSASGLSEETPPLANRRGLERGTVVDRNGVPLAFDGYRWEVWVEPNQVPEGQEIELATQITGLLGDDMLISREDLERLLSARKPGVVMLARRASSQAGESVASWRRFDVGAKAIPVRYYPQGAMAAHMMGFVNGEPRAYYGVEQYYDEYLRALDAPFFLSDPSIQASYDQLPAAWRRALPSAIGQDLVLTLDRRAQFITEQVLAEAVQTYRADSGTIVVMDPRDGAVLAMASVPGYDPNQYGLIDNMILANPAISRQYEPGSVFKIITMAAGIDAGLITPTTVLSDTLSLEVGERTIYNSLMRSYGQVTAREALVRSLNIPTAEVALLLEESRFYQYVRRFGFGQLTEIDLADELAGTVKVPGDRLWSRSDLATNSFGQGLAVTPVQLIRAAAVIANGGQLVRPHVRDSLVFRGRVKRIDSTPVRRVIRPETAAEMTDMMVSVVQEATVAAQVPGYRVAGKTGTAQVAIEGGYHPTHTIHSFVGFVPAEDPAFVALVKLDVPKTNPWADGTAAPTFARLAARLLQLWHVPQEQVATRP